jgi:hypothetical protein
MCRSIEFFAVTIVQSTLPSGQIALLSRKGIAAALRIVLRYLAESRWPSCAFAIAHDRGVGFPCLLWFLPEGGHSWSAKTCA